MPMHTIRDATTTTGSNRAAIVPPSGKSSRRWLMVGLGLVVAVLALFFLVPTIVDETVAPISDEIGEVGVGASQGADVPAIGVAD